MLCGVRPANSRKIPVHLFDRFLANKSAGLCKRLTASGTSGFAGLETPFCLIAALRCQEALLARSLWTLSLR
jgi:hypothetical protein